MACDKTGDGGNTVVSVLVQKGWCVQAILVGAGLCASDFMVHWEGNINLTLCVFCVGAADLQSLVAIKAVPLPIVSV